MAIQRYSRILSLALLFITCISCEQKTDKPLDKPSTQLDSDAPSTNNSQPPHLPTKNQDKSATLKVLDIDERNNNGKNGIAITLSKPIDSSINFQAYFVINQDKVGQVDGEWTVGKDPKQIWFMNTEPQTQYQVTVNPGLKSQKGSTLIDAKTVNITTRKLLTSVNFDSNGSVLPLNYKSGIPVVSVNIESIDVDFFRISDEQLAEFSANINYYGNNSWYTQRLTELGSLIYSGRFDLSPQKNTRTKRDLPIHTIKELKNPGLYFAVMRVPGNYEKKQTTWFSITDIGIHIRQYNNQIDVHANSLTSGKPLANINLQLLNDKSEIIQESTTTPEGLASFIGDFPSGATLLARTDEQLTIIDLRQPALDLSEFDLGSRPQLPVELFIYSPRDLYRPGENIIFSGLLRDQDGQLNHPPTLSAQIKAPNGTVIKRFKWQNKKLGYYQYQWTIPNDAATGKWQITVTGSLKTPVSYTFHVEEFLPERLKLSLADGKKRTELAAQATATIAVLGEYLYGAPASSNRLSAFYQTSHWRSPIDSLKNYQFGHILDQDFIAYQELNDLALDTEGKAKLIIPSNWKNTKAPLKVMVTTSLYESGGRPVTRSHPLLIWPTESLVGIRPHFKEKSPEANSIASFDFLNANLQGDLLAAKNIDITLIKEDRQYFWEYTDHQGWHWEWTEKEYPVTNQSITLEKGKYTTLHFPVDWGRYRLEAKDTSNNTITSIQFFAGHNWYYDWSNAKNGAASPTQVNLALDKSAYQSGDTAKLKILPPSAGEALILVEGDKPLWSQKISVPAEGTTLDIPISADWKQHNLYVTALIIEPSGRKQQITPKRSLGLIHLPLNREKRKLSIEFDTPEKMLPDTTLNTRIHINDNTANASTPKQTFVTLAAVDVGVLSISNFKTPDPFEYFFGPRRYDINVRDMYSSVIESQRFEQAKLRFGGDADLVRGGNQPQSEIQIVSLFSGMVTVDGKGNADIPLQIPDFNGRLRLMALTFSDNAFGSNETEITVAAPIIAEISMPRFLAYSDKSTIALDVQNMTEETDTLEIHLETSGAIKAGKKTYNVTLEPKQKTTFKLPIEAISFEGKGTIHASLEGKTTKAFSREWSIGVRPAYPALTQRQELVLKPDESLNIKASDMAHILPQTLRASTAISPTIDLQVAEQLKGLLSYPYGCLEQTSSKGYPLTFATTENQNRFNMSPIIEDNRRDMIQKGVDRIARFQKNNGSFGLWSKTSKEEHWLTVYATDFLLNAQEMGIDVPSSVVESALKRLTYYLNSSGIFIQQRWSKKPEHYSFATRAYAAYVLSRVKKSPLGSLRTLYKRSFKNAKSGLAQTHLGLALLNMGDKKNGQEALQKAIKNTPEEYSYWGDYGSEIRDLGMMVYLLLSNKQLEDEALKLSLKLKDAIQGRHWFSTQERTALFLSGIALDQELDSPWLAQLQLGDNDPSSIESKNAWRKTFSDTDIIKGITIQSKHEKPLFSSVLINGYGVKAPPEESNGLSITRNWYTATGQQTTPDKIKVGDLLLVHLSISSNKRIPDALVMNLLPAGLELENQNLEHAIKLNNFRVDGKSIQDLQSKTQTQHIEYRDDRLVAAIDHYHQSHLFFAVRSVTPGIYKVPPPIVEDMYRPEIRGVGYAIDEIEIVSP